MFHFSLPPRRAGLGERSQGRLGVVLALAFLACGLAVGPGNAAEGAGASAERQYGACMALARSRPDQAFEKAGQWKALGGGVPARHCEAVALLGLKEYGEAARRLEALAEDVKLARGLRVDLLTQAGQAWLAVGDLSRAYANQTTALQLAGARAQSGAPALSSVLPDLYIDRAVTLAQAGRDDEATTDLTKALALQPASVTALVLRASAQRRQGRLTAARADAEAAVKRAPDDAEARLERGDVRLALGDRDGARADWLKVLELAPREGAADAARARIETLDLKVR
ncbi:hypothetical protein CKO38_03440 [Rhodospirillum rubrum]|uniref:tetratricopeptide repeat protein n=1 Tax=Rhodospirillum rubrum TaxID=1085 RepID=UPI001906F635|nr:tetratricopeptide repeat protein [Rhodospirillum rubrum]MBK1663134.1 hypothetical protein [Rhodospirillum rubrum]MBK1675745.1 hypothetical protein [Rhodospirillum rubrum]